MNTIGKYTDSKY